MKKIRNIIILVILIVGWLVLMLNFSKEKEQLSKEEVPQYMVLNGYVFWEYKLGNWKDLTKESEYDLINWKKFDVYNDDGYLGMYKYVYNDYVSYFFDDDDRSHEIYGNYILMNENSYLSMKDFDETNVNEDDYGIVRKFLEKNKIMDTSINYLFKYRITDSEYVYVVSNYEETLINEDIYYIVFYRRNNRNYLISKGDYEHNYNLYKILDINKKYDNFILSYDCDGLCFEMYQYDKKKGYYNVLEE